MANLVESKRCLLTSSLYQHLQMFVLIRIGSSMVYLRSDFTSRQFIKIITVVFIACRQPVLTTVEKRTFGFGLFSARKVEEGRVK
jgi:uncharacterized protein YbcI